MAIHPDDTWMKIRTQPRWAQFNDSTGALGYCTANGPTGAHSHPDRCKCQGDDPISHKHYGRDHPEHGCARCPECKEYEPAIPERKGRLVGIPVKLLGRIDAIMLVDDIKCCETDDECGTKVTP